MAEDTYNEGELEAERLAAEAKLYFDASLKADSAASQASTAFTQAKYAFYAPVDTKAALEDALKSDASYLEALDQAAQAEAATQARLEAAKLSTHSACAFLPARQHRDD